MPGPVRKIAGSGFLTRRLSRLSHENRKIARDLFLVIGFVFLAKAVGAAKEMAIAWRFGVSEVVDAYLFVFNLTQWPVAIWAGVIPSVLVPIAVRIQSDTPEELPRFRSEILGGCLMLSISLGVAAFFLLPWMVAQPWIGLTRGQVEIARQMSGFLAWCIPFGIVSYLLAAWTMAGQRHVNTLLEGMPALMILIFVLVMSGSDALVIGTLVGAALQVVFLCYLLARRREMSAPSVAFGSPYWSMFFNAFSFLLLSQAVVATLALVDQFFAARLGPGALSVLSYMARILALTTSLGALAISRAMLPVISEAHVKGTADIVKISSRWAMVLFCGGTIVAGLMALLAGPIVQILFERGAFTAGNTETVAALLRYGVLQLPFYFASTALVYTLMAQQKPKQVLLLAVVNAVTKITLCFLLVPGYGLRGLLLATAGMYLVSTIATWLVLGGSKYLRGRFGGAGA